MAKFCTNCGSELKEGQVFCTNCGKKDGEEVKEEVKTTTTTVTNNVSNTAKEPTNGLAIAGFVTSLVSSLLCCGMFNLVGLVLSIVGLIKAKDYNGKGKGLAIAGIVICAVVMVLSVVLGFIIGITGETMPEVIDELNSI